MNDEQKPTEASESDSQGERTVPEDEVAAAAPIYALAPADDDDSSDLAEPEGDDTPTDEAEPEEDGVGAAERQALIPAANQPAQAARPIDAREPASASTWAWFLALVGWTAIVAFYALDRGAAFEPTDAWVGQTAREMLDAGEWVLPRFSGETRLHKSPGPYWAVMAAALFRGGTVDEAATRLPSAIAAVILVIAVFWLARAMAGDRAAVFAGFAAASSTLVLHWSHRGASDLGVATCVTVCLAALWIGSNCHPPGGRQKLLWMLGYFAAGVGMLYKMPLPLVCVGLPALAYVLLRNRWRILASRWHLLGLILFLLPWLPWVVAVYMAEPGALDCWKVEFWTRLTGDLPNIEAHKHWSYYFAYLIPVAVFTVPYTLSLPAAVVRAFRRSTSVSRDGRWFLLLWFGSLLAFFTFAAGKEARYFLAALPPLFVLLGIELAVLFDPKRVAPALRTRLGVWGVWLLVPIGLLGGAYGMRRWHEHLDGFAWPEVWVPYAVTAGLFGVAAWVAAGLYGRGRRNGAFATLVGGIWVMWFWAWPQFMPVLVSGGPFVDFGRQLADRLPVEDRAHLQFVGSPEPRIIWESNVQIPRVIDQFKLLEMQDGRRSLEVEEQLIGKEIIGRLRGDEPVLFVARRIDFIRFLAEAPGLAEREGLTYEAPDLWLQTAAKYPTDTHFVLFGNQPAPWGAMDLEPPIPVGLRGESADAGPRCSEAGSTPT